MTSRKFKILYQQLNPGQREAVDTIEGPVLVIAGPGTGKTQVLTLRIANILLKTDTSPDSILALTFTQAAAGNMRRRLVEIIGSAAYRLELHTFHGFCNEVIRTYPESFPDLLGRHQADPAEQIGVLKNILTTGRYQNLRPLGEPFYYLPDIRRAIDRLKRENISPSDFAGQIKKITLSDGQEKYLARNQELARVYSTYEVALAKAKLYDFGDTIMAVIRVLGTNEDLLRALQEDYQYLLADEHQDANGAQNRLLELLANYHSEPNLFIVGDEKQAIFQFQGASLDNFNYFKKLYPGAKIVNLKHNYRSTQTILDSAHSLISSSTRLRAKTSQAGEKIIIYPFSTSEHQYRWLAEAIARGQTRGEPLEQMAVLYRDNSDAAPVVAALERRALPYSLWSDDNLLADPVVAPLILILDAINNFGQAEKFEKLLVLEVFDLDPLLVFKFMSLVNNKNNKFDIFVQAGKTAGIKKVYNLYRGWRRLAQSTLPLNVVEAVIKESGLLGQLLAKTDGVSGVAKVRAFFDLIKAMTVNKTNIKLAEVMERLATLTEAGAVRTPGLVKPGQGGGVQLMTVHRAKGLEFDTVYLTDVYDGHWGNRRARSLLRLPTRGSDEFEPLGLNTIDDERRLFYVALTRAREEVIITYPTQTPDGRDLLPSQFVAEISPKFKIVMETGKIEANYNKSPAQIFAPRASTGPRLTDKKFIRELFRDRGLAVTHLNNYLTCPWQYFFVNLLRLPQTPTPVAHYGTAVHQALQKFFFVYGEHGRTTKKLLIESFKQALNKLPLTSVQLKELTKKGEKALGGYYDYYKNKWPKVLETELNIAGVELAPGIRLTGKIDKIEEFGTVVDYKSRQPKSRREIEGLTKNSDGNYKRQLIFYKLLLDHYAGGKYKMTAGEVDFIEPDGKGRYKKEKFEISDQEVEELTDLIKKTVAEITTLAFWDQTCDRKDCEYCKLRQLMLAHP